jgi:2,3-bisphosphoglycerate-independent phosphoglycerate mutase
VAAFGEAPATAGAFGVLRAADILPVLLGYANRPGLLGSRIAATDTIGFPDNPAAFPAGFGTPPAAPGSEPPRPR